MRLGCLLPILAVGLLIGGGQGLFVGLTNRSPTVLEFEEFLRQKPTRGWYEIRGGRLNLMEAIHQTKRLTGRITRAYVPVTSAAGDDDGEIHLLLLTEDESILKALAGLRDAAGEGGGLVADLKRRKERRERADPDANADADADREDVANALRFAVQNRDRLFMKRPVRGTIQFGLDIDRRDRRKIAALDADLADDFVVLEDGKRPEPILYGFMFLIGLALTVYLISRAAGGGTRATPAPPGDAGLPAVPPDEAFGPGPPGGGVDSASGT